MNGNRTIQKLFRRMWLIAALLMCRAFVSPSVISAQEFFDLTAEEVKIDSVLPFFSHTFPLGTDYANADYEVTIEYPEFYDMSPADVRRYHAITADTLPEMPAVRQYVGVSRKEGVLHVGFVPLVYRDGKYQKLVSFKLNLSRRLVARRAGQEQESVYASHSVLSSGQWAKISVPETGIYQITESLVRQAGFSDISKVKVFGYGGALQPEQLTSDYLSATDDLKEVPVCIVNGKRLFHAVGPVGWSSATTSERTRNFYANEGCYFLTQSDSEPLTVDSAAFALSFYPTNNDYHSLHEVDDFAWYHSGRNLSESTLLSSAGTHRYQLKAHDKSGTLQVNLTANGPFSVDVYLNDSLVGTIANASEISSYSRALARSGTFVLTDVLQNENTIVLKQVSGSADVRLDYISLTMATPEPMPSLSKGTFDTPSFVYRITNQDLHADSSVDMVIIIPTSQKFVAQAERLKKLHETEDSLSVRIVPADELYNEFSSGTPDGNAYRRYLKMLYDRAESDAESPRYLLLFGDGAWDNRLLSSGWHTYSADDFLLCYQSENSFSETESYVSDDYFCMLDDGEGGKLTVSDQADVGVGRLTARTDAEAKVLVDKIVSYHSNTQAGAWQNTLCFMADDGNENVHMQEAEAALQAVEGDNNNFLFKRIYWDAYPRVASSTGYSFPDVTKLIKQQMVDGALIMDYCGHGANYCLSHEKVILRSDFEATTSRLPLWVTASCDIMPYDGQEENIGETAMLNPHGGAIAFYGTTRTVWTNDNLKANRAFLRRVIGSTNGRRNSLGDAVRLSKNEVWTSHGANKLHYTLLGDPALVLSAPSGSIVVDSINGVSVADNKVRLHAGSKVTVSGHVPDDDSFDGVVTVTVRDVEETIQCRMNDPTVSTAYVYKDRPRVIYNGTDSVRHGRFSLTFALPLDISYSDATGLITLYAVDNAKHEVHGRDESFTLGAAEELVNDGVGPSVYCYLNSSSFVNGGTVNTTPYFYAELSDKDGINAAGNGIGHDLELVVDGSSEMTYCLNDYFQCDFGDYTRGSLGFTLPELSEGPHKLLFRAWDVLNNPSVAELSFSVVKGLTPQCFSVMCTKNPATTTTTFIINHDRIGSTIDVDLEVFDMSGRQLWAHHESGVSTDNTYSVDWDLTVEGGSRLQTGVYLYRVWIGEGGSKKSSLAKKLIVLRQ